MVCALGAPCCTASDSRSTTELRDLAPPVGLEPTYATRHTYVSRHCYIRWVVAIQSATGKTTGIKRTLISMGALMRAARRSAKLAFEIFYFTSPRTSRNPSCWDSHPTTDKIHSCTSLVPPITTFRTDRWSPTILLNQFTTGAIPISTRLSAFAVYLACWHDKLLFYFFVFWCVGRFCVGSPSLMTFVATSLRSGVLTVTCAAPVPLITHQEATKPGPVNVSVRMTVTLYRFRFLTCPPLT